MKDIKKLSQVNDDLLTLCEEVRGLKAIVDTLSVSTYCSNAYESTDDMLARISAPYCSISASLDGIIKKLNGFADDIDNIDSYMTSDDEGKEVA